MLKYRLRKRKRIGSLVFFAALFSILTLMFLNRSLELNTGKSFWQQRNKAEVLTEEERNWLQKKEPLKAAVLVDHEPLSGVTVDGQLHGVDVQYLEHLAEELGVRLEIIPIDRRHQMGMILNGNVDLALAPPTLKHSNGIKFTIPVYQIRYIIVAAQGHSVTALESLANRRIAYLHNDYTAEFLQIKGIEHEAVTVSNISEGFLHLKEQAADLLVGPEPLIMEHIRRHYGLEEHRFQIADFFAFDKEYSLAVSRGQELLFSALNKAVHNLNQSGAMVQIQQITFGLTAPLAREPLAESYFLILVIFALSLSLIFYFFYFANSTLRMEIEEKMRELDTSRQELQVAFDGMKHVILVIDTGYRIRLLNEYAARWFNKPPALLEGKTLQEVTGEIIAEKINLTASEAFCSGKSAQRCFQHEKNIFELSAFPLEQKEGRVNKVLLMLKDVTENYRQEQILLQKNKMAAIGQLAAGV